MSEVTLDEILSLNDELAALADEGVPIQAKQDRDTLQRINKSLSVRSSLGQSLIDATAGNEDVPPVYRSALQIGLRTGNLASTLEGLETQESATEQLRKTLSRALIPTLFLVVIAYVAFLVLCLYYVPTLEGMYLQTQEQPGWQASWVIGLRNTMPVWATLVPMVALVGCWLWWSNWFDWQRFLPGAQHYKQAVRDANFANQTRTLLVHGNPLPESIALAASVTGDVGLIQATDNLVLALQQNESPLDKMENLEPIPPLMRWALTHDLGGQSLPEILSFAESLYRRRADHMAIRWSIGLPTILGAVLGGVIVLVYGLGLFGPFIELIQDLAQSKQQ